MADFLASGAGASPYLYVWNTSGWSKLTDPAVLPTAQVTQLAWAPDNGQLVVGSNSATNIIIYETAGWTKLSDLGSLPALLPLDIAYSPNGAFICATYSSSPYFSKWNASNRTLISGGWAPGGGVNACDFSPSSGRLAIAGGAALYILDTSTWNIASQPITYNLAVTDVEYSPDGTKLSAAIPVSPYLKTWNTSTGAAVADPSTLPTSPQRIAYSPDSALLAVGCSSGTRLRIYSSVDHSLVATPATQPAGTPTGLDFSPDGSLLAVRVASGTPSHVIYDTSTWTPISGPGSLPAASSGRLAFSNLTNTSLAADAHAVADASGDIGKVSLAAAGHAETNVGAQFAGGAVPLSAAAQAGVAGSAASSGPVTQPAVMAWRPVVTIGGVDYSARLIGSISVEEREDSARVCDFSILPFSGTILPQQMIGKAVTIDFADKGAGGAAINLRRIFTGLIDVPSMRSDSGIMELSCTDDYQGKVAAMGRAQIDATVGGMWSDVLSDADADNWIYLQDRMDSVKGSCEIDVLGGLRLTPWAPRAAPHFTFTNSSLITADFYFAARSEVVNRVEVQFDYRSPRLKKRVVNCGYSYPFGQSQIMLHGYSIPSRAMIASAISGTGWEVNGEITFTPCPAAPQPPVNLGGGNYGSWGITPDVAEDLCFGFVVGLRKRFAQQARHIWQVDVKANASITALGEIKRPFNASLASSFDAREWESYKSPAVVDGVWEATGPSEPEPIVPDPVGEGETYVDPTTGAGDDMSDAMACVEVMVAQAQKIIAGSHRGSGVRIATPIQPLLSCASTVRVDCRNGLAQGKARMVRHDLDLDSGKCITTADVAISSLMGTGYSHPNTVFVAPEHAPAPPSSNQEQPSGMSTYVGSKLGAQQINDTMFGYFTNVQSGSSLYSAAAPVYPVQFALRAPGIGDDSRDNDERTIVTSADAAIQEDLFEVYVP